MVSNSRCREASLCGLIRGGAVSSLDEHAFVVDLGCRFDDARQHQRDCELKISDGSTATPAVLAQILAQTGLVSQQRAECFPIGPVPVEYHEPRQ